MTSDLIQNGYARTYRDLVVFKKAKSVARQIFVLTLKFPKDERYSLTDQLRRSSRSVGAQIAEAWAKRRYEKHFVSKLTDADGEQLETQYWIEEARDCSYIDASDAAFLIEELEVVGRMLNGKILKAHLFCQDDSRAVHEESANYFVGAAETDYRSQATGH